jgi:hypothetical protein
MLVLKPVINYPQMGSPYALITNAAAGDDKIKEGWVLFSSQMNANREHSLIAYVSWN